MSPSYLKYLERQFNLIEEGKLPESSITRLFYYGHECLGSIHKHIRKYKCVDCQVEWEGKCICPKCNIDERNKPVGCYNFKIWDITGDSQIADWRCRECKYEWRGEDGTVCPECKAVSKK